MSFGLSAKDRLAQLQKGQDSAGPKGPGKLNVASKFGPTTGDKGKAPTTPTKEPEKVESAKPKEEPKKTPGKEEIKKTAEIKEKEEPKRAPEAKAKPETKKMEEKPKMEPAKQEPAKPAEPSKSKEEAKTPEAAKSVEVSKPKEESKKSGPNAEVKINVPNPAETKPSPAPTAATPQEQPKPAAPKPVEQPKPTAAPTPAPTPNPTPNPTATAPTPAAAASSTKPGEQSKPAAAAAPTQQQKPAAAAPAAIAAAPVPAAGSVSSQRPHEDFFTNIFYFSGMGSLIGSALAEGVYVPERNQRNALDAEEIEAAKERAKGRTEEIVTTARSQAQGLSTDFRQLQSLLDTLPTFTDTLVPQPLDKRGIDQPIHGHRYFHQTERSHSRQSAPVNQDISANESRRAPAGGVTMFPTNESDIYYQQQQQQRERQRLDEESRRRIEAEQLAANQSSSRSSAPPFKSPYQHDGMQNGGGQIYGRGPEYGSRGQDVGRVGEDGYSGGHGGGQRGERVPSDPAAAQQGWQDKYSLQDQPARSQRQSAPRRPDDMADEYRDGGDLDTAGIKPWQMSHIRTLEAKGYHIVDHEGEPTGGNWSYAPYLVSERSKSADIQLRGGNVGRSPVPQVYRPPSQHNYGGGYNDSSLPYCDL